ncbi:MAG TPA: double zinc ribbon domain-containing protein, partial [Pirellulales bacterium]|nr:double zinc ribbon domain-containing protein [Pirellulales bacterium]
MFKGSNPTSGMGMAARRRILARRWLIAGLDLVFPPACACCQIPLDGEATVMVCADCQAGLMDQRRACPRCGMPEAALAADAGCVHCHHDRLYFGRVVRLGAYEGPLRKAVLRTKDPRDRGLAMALGDLLANQQSSVLESWQPEAVV